jgi:hypothetical protein
VFKREFVCNQVLETWIRCLVAQNKLDHARGPLRARSRVDNSAHNFKSCKTHINTSVITTNLVMFDD